MLLKYYSNWIITLFIVWYISYLCNIPIVNYINPYYSLILICGGYTLLTIYLIYYKDYHFEPSFLVCLSLIHYIPLIIMYYLTKKSFNVNNSILTLALSFFLYTLYLSYKQTDVYTVYLVDEHPKSWKEINLSFNY
jgi:hypothetical protein